MSLSYKSSGVDISAGYKSVELIKGFVNNTKIDGVVSGIGGFGGLFSLAAFKNMDEPILVCGTDGVGTKLKVAFLMDKHDTIGIDCVAMCVNDIICCGAKPLFLLDYIACGKNKPEKIAEIVKGVAAGASMSAAALIGGETAEMPGLYLEDEYDIAGFAVGIVDRNKIIDGSSIAVGDVVIGITSSGIHSNGYSLVRKVFNLSESNINSHFDCLDNTLGEVLLTPTEIYTNTILTLNGIVNLKGIANITGGGFFENIPRILPDGLCAAINPNSWTVPAIFSLIKELGDIDLLEMFNTFNMGIGMVVVVSPSNVNTTLNTLSKINKNAYVIGEIVKGEGVLLC